MVRRWFAVVVVLGLLLVGPSAGSSEKRVFMRLEGHEYSYPPGPGWPAGWVEPAAPTQLSASDMQLFEMEKFIPGSTVESIELFVSPVIPPWTSEYPWKWSREVFACGTVLVVHYHPAPDYDVFKAMTGNTVSWSQERNQATCEVKPITRLQINEDMSEYTRERGLQEYQMYLDQAWAQLAPEGTLDIPYSFCPAFTGQGSLDSIMVCFNGVEASRYFDSAAFLDAQAGRVRVPLRFVSEMMRAQVDWDDQTQQITIRFPELHREVTYMAPKDGYTVDTARTEDTHNFVFDRIDFVKRHVHQPARTIVLTVGDLTAYVDGQPVQIDAAPIIVPPGRTMVPVRFVSEVMGAKVFWVGRETIWPQTSSAAPGFYQVHIFTPFWPNFEYPNYYLEQFAQGF